MGDVNTVGLGSRVQVELRYAADAEILDLVIVSDRQADFSAGFLGEGSLLAQALLGRQAGETLDYTAGDVISVRILAVGAAMTTSPPEDAAARREERMRRAVEQAQKTDAMIFASSFSGKWGDYDPKGIEDWDV